jgi:hypothetical protein
MLETTSSDDWLPEKVYFPMIRRVCSLNAEDLATYVTENALSLQPDESSSLVKRSENFKEYMHKVCWSESETSRQQTLHFSRAKNFHKLILASYNEDRYDLGREPHDVQLGLQIAHHCVKYHKGDIRLFNLNPGLPTDAIVASFVSNHLLEGKYNFFIPNVS